MAQRPAVPELAVTSVSFMMPMAVSVPGDVIAAAGSVVTFLFAAVVGCANRKAVDGGCSSRKESAAEVQLEWGRPHPQRKTSEHSSGGLGSKRQSGAAELTAYRLDMNSRRIR